MKIQLKTYYKTFLADTTTPVSAYLRLRDRYPNSLLLESNDFHAGDNSYSYICCNPIASIQLFKGKLCVEHKIGQRREKSVEQLDLVGELNSFIGSFEVEESKIHGLVANGLFGYLSFNASQYLACRNIRRDDKYFVVPSRVPPSIPDIFYSVYQFIITISHFTNKLYVFNNVPPSVSEEEALRQIDELCYILNNKEFPFFSFETIDKKETSNLEFDMQLSKYKQEIERRQIHSVVAAEPFGRRFYGDDFNVYRAVRSENPSPYLFYFDFGSYKLIGSSDETQLSIKSGKAAITYLENVIERKGDDKADLLRAEHMVGSNPEEIRENELVLAGLRSELRSLCHEITFSKRHFIEMYAHQLKLVTKITGKLNDPKLSICLLAETFPSPRHIGFPKQEALQLINEIETGERTYFGGSIGYIGFNGDLNHALMNKAFLSKDNELVYYCEVKVKKDTDLKAIKQLIKQHKKRPDHAIETAAQMPH